MDWCSICILNVHIAQKTLYRKKIPSSWYLCFTFIQTLMEAKIFLLKFFIKLAHILDIWLWSKKVGKLGFTDNKCELTIGL